MAHPKKKPVKSKPKKKSPPISEKKKSSKKLPPKKPAASKKSKKSSGAESYKVVALHPKTGKVIAKPKKGQEVYFGVKGPKNKVQKLEVEFSQKYVEADAKAIQASIRSAGPDAFLVYQQLTRTPLRLPDGSFDYKTLDGKIVYRETKSGKKVPEKKYTYKLTGKKLRQKQRTVVMGVKGYVHAASVGFTPKTSQESARGIKLLPVRRGSSTAIVLKGETIKDTVRNLRPAIGTRDMVKKGIQKLGVTGTIEIARPKNPYRKGTADHAKREAWMQAIWGVGGSGVIAIPFSRVIDRLANFSDTLSVAIREALSKQGYRVTSLMKLQAIEETVEADDEDNRRAGRKFSPKAKKIIKKPMHWSDLSADKMIPLRPENEFDHPLHKSNSAYNAGITLNLNVEPLK